MVSFFGGKSKMSEWIYQFIPKDITTYAEPFSGAFWVYFDTKLNYSHVKNIRYNDINKFTANLFACAKNYTEFIPILEKALSPGGFLYADKSDPEKYKEFYKSLYYDFKNNPQNTFLEDTNFNIPDYEVGMKYSFLITSAFNGCWPKAAGFSGVNNNRLKLYALINKLKDKKYQQKLDNITSFETLDFEEFINKYDNSLTFFYLDPPYQDDKANRLMWYGVKDDSKFGQLSHKRLADLLKNTKAKWALSYYYYEDLEVWFPKDKYTWITKEFFRSSASFSENKEIKGNELLILNYTPNSLVNILTDEIEEANGGAFIRSDIMSDAEKAEVFKNFTTKLISEQKDIDPDIAEIVNENYKELLYTEEEEITAEDFDKKFDENKEDVIKHLDLEQISRVNKEEDIDDFWLS